VVKNEAGSPLYKLEVKPYENEKTLFINNIRHEQELITNHPLTVNGGKSIREENDKFGRGITEVRRELTKNDTQPFATKT
jgi:hypothetical protein